MHLFLSPNGSRGIHLIGHNILHIPLVTVRLHLDYFDVLGKLRDILNILPIGAKKLKSCLVLIKRGWPKSPRIWGPKLPRFFFSGHNIDLLLTIGTYKLHKVVLNDF